MFVCSIKVVPSSGRSECILDKNGQLKCFLKSAPEKGKANKELIKLFADALSLARNQVEIVSGLTSRTKRIKIASDITWEQLLDKLGIQYQRTLF